jgi:hypothetical protein
MGQGRAARLAAGEIGGFLLTRHSQLLKQVAGAVGVIARP